MRYHPLEQHAVPSLAEPLNLTVVRRRTARPDFDRVVLVIGRVNQLVTPAAKARRSSPVMVGGGPVALRGVLCAIS